MEEQIVSLTEKVIASKFVEKGFVPVPNFIVKSMYEANAHLRNRGRVHHYLWTKCLFADEKVEVYGEEIPCKQGEFVGTREDIAEALGIPKSTIRRLLKELEELGYIKDDVIVVNHKVRCSRIQVVGYVSFREKIQTHGQPKPKPYVTTPKKQNPPVKEDDDDDDDDWFEGFIPDPQMCA